MKMGILCCSDYPLCKHKHIEQVPKAWGNISNTELSPPRVFPTGASRDSDTGKLDYEGFLSPLVLESYAKYMHKNRTLGDGSVRASDNWTKGIPVDQYMKSLYRHFMDVHKSHRGLPISVSREEALCAVLFNVMGMLYEELKEAKP